MRTTLTLDPDLVAALRERMRRSGTTWKEVVNEVIRRGLNAERFDRTDPGYATPPYDPGPPALRGVTSVHEMLAFAEGEDYR